MDTPTKAALEELAKRIAALEEAIKGLKATDPKKKADDAKS